MPLSSTSEGAGPGAYVAEMVLNRVLVRGHTWKVPFAHPEPEYWRPKGAHSLVIDQYHPIQPNL